MAGTRVHGIRAGLHRFFCPPSEDSGNIYVVGTDNDNNNEGLRVNKSSDGGVNFAVVNDYSGPDMGEEIQATASIQKGRDIHIITTHDDSEPITYVQYHKFSMSSQTWVITNEAIWSGVIQPGAQSCDIAARDDGDLVAVHPGTYEGGNNARINYSVRESGHWATSRLDDGGGNGYTSPVIVVGADDRVHMFYANQEDNLHHKVLIPSALGYVILTCADCVPGTYGGTLTRPILYDDEGVERIIIGKSNGQGLIINDDEHEYGDWFTVGAIKHNAGYPYWERLYCLFMAVDVPQKRAYFIFSKESDDDVWFGSNLDGAHETEEIVELQYANCFQNGGVNATVYTRGSSVYLAYTYTDGEDAVIRFSEYFIRAA